MHSDRYFLNLLHTHTHRNNKNWELEIFTLTPCNRDSLLQTKQQQKPHRVSHIYSFYNTFSIVDDEMMLLLLCVTYVPLNVFGASVPSVNWVLENVWYILRYWSFESTPGLPMTKRTFPSHSLSHRRWHVHMCVCIYVPMLMMMMTIIEANKMKRKEAPTSNKLI